MSNQQQQDEALEPCPFCGSANLNLSNGYDEDANWVVICRACKSSGTFCVEKSRAIERWNTRSCAGVAPAARWDKSGLKEACQRALRLGRTYQETDIQLFLDMLLEIERLEDELAATTTSSPAAQPDELRRIPRVNALLVALRHIRDKSDSHEGAKEIALRAIEDYIESPAATSEGEQE